MMGLVLPSMLQVLYDDSWLDEVACILFLVSALVLMTRPYTEVSVNEIAAVAASAAWPMTLVNSFELTRKAQLETLAVGMARKQR